MMRRVLWCIIFLLVITASLVADSNLRITDVGLHGYYGTPSAVRLIVRNPSSQPQVIHLQVAAGNENDVANTVTTDVTLSGDERRAVELPVLMFAGKVFITADASSAGAFVGQDKHEEVLRQTNLIVMLCASENVCKTAQAQIQFSGTIEERADKNRQTTFETVDDPRDHWWAYSASSAVVLAMPMTKLAPAQRDALEGFLRSGGRLVLLEDEIADPSFLSAYRTAPASPTGERVGKGTLFRVSGLGANALGDVFVGRNLASVFGQNYTWRNSNQLSFLPRRFATSFDFPGLRWVLIWLAAYTVVIGIVNFAVLRHFRRLELGWISMCVLALLFAAGFYFSSASRRPRSFRLDNLATYYLDARSPLAAADYNLRVSAPDRREVLVSIADPAVFTYPNLTGEEPNSQIWAEMNRQGAQVRHQYDIHLGPPSQVDLSLLKWSFHDLDLQGLHEFSGTVHFVAPTRLRNDTGRRFGEAIYLDYTSNSLYALPALPPGEEIQLDAITPRPIRTKDLNQVWTSADLDYSKQSLPELALKGALPFLSTGRVFAGLSDGPALPVELNVPHQQSAHSLVIVVLEQQ
ncbi:MAG: hypothetical protein ABSG70_14180 [Terriglobales bacterium]|jgi:hypothetical protein